VKKPVWITEFAITNGTPAQQLDLLTKAMAWLDQQSFVERYSWFWAGPNTASSLVNEDGSLAALGKAYNS
jgi:hypothetical protein